MVGFGFGLWIPLLSAQFQILPLVLQLVINGSNGQGLTCETPKDCEVGNKIHVQIHRYV